jgi:hypothetical protein
MGLFSPSISTTKSKEKSKATQVSNPFAGMPEWMVNSFKGDAARQGGIMDAATGIAEDMAADPRDIAGLNQYDEAGLTAGKGGFSEADRLAGLGEDAIAGLGGLEGKFIDPALGFVDSSAAMGGKALGQTDDVSGSIDKGQGFIDASTGRSDQAAGFMGDTTLSDQAAGVAGDTTASDAAMAAAGYDMDALRGKYTSGYTDDVVNTTLAGMQRTADRERLAREGRAASVGGTTNTRAAVGDAVAQQLTGMNMAEQEATLRDQGFRTAIEGAQGEAKLELDRARAYDTFANTGLSRGSLLDDLAKTGISRGLGMDTLANTDLSRAGAQGDITADELKLGEFYRGLSSDDLSRAGAMEDLGRFGLDIGETTADLYGEYATGAAGRGVNEAAMYGTYGDKAREIAQAEIDAEHNAGRDAYGWLGDLFNTTQYNKGPVGGTTTTKTKTTGSNQTPGASPFSQIVGGATAIMGAAQMSDENAKEDITPFGRALDDIRAIVPRDYRYKPGLGHVTGPTRGLIAQEVSHIPGAQVRMQDGHLGVDSYPVLATVVRAVQELDARTRPPEPQTSAGLEAA